MTELEINQIIQEKAMGGCWHEIDDNGYVLASNPMSGKCRHCRGLMTKGKPNNPSFTSSWADYGPMLEQTMKKEWWFDFLFLWHGSRRGHTISIELLNPLKGSTALAEFLEGRKE